MRFSGKRLMAIAGVGAAAYAVGSKFQPTVVLGDSMAPTLKDGAVIYVDRTHYESQRPQRGEVVVFAHEGGVYVKRVYRAPGEMIHYLTDGFGVAALIGDERLADMRQRYGGRSGRLRLVSERIPEDSVFVLGDNFNRSEDSRVLGPIPIQELLGRAHVESDPTVACQFELRPKRYHPRHHVVLSADAGKTPRSGS